MYIYTVYAYESMLRRSYVNCYQTGEGCSGRTYQEGFIDAIKSTSPRIAFFENTVGVAEISRGNDGNIEQPMIEVTNENIFFIIFFCFIYIYILYNSLFSYINIYILIYSYINIYIYTYMYS